MRKWYYIHWYCVDLLYVFMLYNYTFFSVLATLAQMAPNFEAMLKGDVAKRRAIYEANLFLQESVAVIQKLSGKIILHVDQTFYKNNNSTCNNIDDTKRLSISCTIL